MGDTRKRRVVAAFAVMAMLFATALNGKMISMNHLGVIGTALAAADTAIPSKIPTGLPGKCPVGGMTANSMAGSCMHCGQTTQTAGLTFALSETPVYTLVSPSLMAVWHGSIRVPDPAPPRLFSIS